MPRFGTLDVAARAPGLVAATRLAGEAWQSEAQVLQLCYEIDPERGQRLLPPALHPAIPTYVTLVLRDFATSPVGPFRMAELRAMGRAGIHPGGFVLSAFADTPGAVALLREAYGLPARAGEVRIERRHYGTLATVRADGATALEAALEHAEPIAAGDFTHAPSLTLALVDGSPAIVQVETSYTPASAERGTPRLRVFDAAAFGDPELKLTEPLPATWMQGTLEVRPVRWLMDPKKPAVVGARRRQP
jgi:hypothetical protein